MVRRRIIGKVGVIKKGKKMTLDEAIKHAEKKAFELGREKRSPHELENEEQKRRRKL